MRGVLDGGVNSRHSAPSGSGAATRSPPEEILRSTTPPSHLRKNASPTCGLCAWACACVRVHGNDV